jgi:hypothetical protein
MRALSSTPRRAFSTVTKPLRWSGSGSSPRRTASAAARLADLKLADCPTTYKGTALRVYRLRHTFATLMKGAHVEPGARDRLMGHRPKDTKAMNYEVNELAFLHAEICKLPSLDSPMVATTKPEPPTNGSNPDTAVPRTAVLVADLVTEKMHASGARRFLQ